MKKKILVVDDEADLLKVTLLRLKGTGYEVVGSGDGRTALDLARQIIPDLIVMDVYLQAMDGDDVAKILKREEKLKRIPIILISADVETLERRARESGAEGYLAKPFEAGDLIGMIEKHIG